MHYILGVEVVYSHINKGNILHALCCRLNAIYVTVADDKNITQCKDPCVLTYIRQVSLV
jgi:hypothetical protein